MSSQLTKVYLCKDVPLNQGVPHTLDFPNVTVQRQYFESKTTLSTTSLSYQRISRNSIKIKLKINESYNINYMYITNLELLPNQNNRYFYCFVDNIEYINDDTAIIYYTLDLIQTYYFDMTVKACYVEREHTNDDSLYSNNLPENFNLGEITERVVVPRNGNFNIQIKYYVAVNKVLEYKSTEEQPYPTPIDTSGLTEITLTPRFFTGIVYEGNYADCYRYVTDAIKWGVDTDIVGVWSAPKATSINTTFSFTIPTSKGNYKNNKILSGQFRRICFITPISSDYIAPESVGNTAYCYVQNPPTAQGTFSFQFSFYSDSPITGADMQFNRVFQTMANGSWSSESLAVYLAQNQSRINFTQSYALQEKDLSIKKLKIDTASSIASSVLNTASGATMAVMGGPMTASMGSIKAAGAISSGFESALNYGVNKELINLSYNKIIDGEAALQEDYDGMPNIPRSSIGNADWVITNTDYLLPELAIFTYSPTVLKNVDDYFSRYGYKTNKVKVPNIIGRSKFNYVKTVSAFVRGEVPQYACTTFQNQLNAGYTFWHIGTDLDDSFVGDYTISNPII